MIYYLIKRSKDIFSQDDDYILKCGSIQDVVLQLKKLNAGEEYTIIKVTEEVLVTNVKPGLA